MVWPFDSCCGSRKPRRQGEREPLLPEDALPVPLPESEQAGPSSQDQLRERKAREAAKRAHDDALRNIVEQASEQIISLRSPAPFLHVYSALVDRSDHRASLHSLHSIRSKRPNASEHRSSSSQQPSTSTQEDTDEFHTAKSHKSRLNGTHTAAGDRQIPEAWQASTNEEQQSEDLPSLANAELLQTEDLLPVSEQESKAVSPSICLSQLDLIRLGYAPDARCSEPVGPCRISRVPAILKQ